MKLALAVVPDFFITLVRYRGFLQQSVQRDLKKRYKRTVMGYCWSMLNPLLMMVVLSIAFSEILGNRIEHYPVFLFTAMIPFQFFSGTVSGCLGVVRANSKIMEQVPAPKYLFPTSICISNLINLLLSFIPLLLIMLVLNRPIPATALLFPFVLLPLFMATMGIALLFAVANVFFEDTQHLTGVILQSIYFLSPVLYGPEHLPDWILPWINWNPMFHLINFSRDIFFYGTLFSAQEYFFTLCLCAGFLLLGLYAFRKAEDKFMYFV